MVVGNPPLLQHRPMTISTGRRTTSTIRRRWLCRRCYCWWRRGRHWRIWWQLGWRAFGRKYAIRPVMCDTTAVFNWLAGKAAPTTVCRLAISCLHIATTLVAAAATAAVTVRVRLMVWLFELRRLWRWSAIYLQRVFFYYYFVL